MAAGSPFSVPVVAWPLDTRYPCPPLASVRSGRKPMATHSDAMRRSATRTVGRTLGPRTAADRFVPPDREVEELSSVDDDRELRSELSSSCVEIGPGGESQCAVERGPAEGRAVVSEPRHIGWRCPPDPVARMKALMAPALRGPDHNKAERLIALDSPNRGGRETDRSYS